jgi:hypothetical protein
MALRPRTLMRAWPPAKAGLIARTVEAGPPVSVSYESYGPTDSGRQLARPETRLPEYRLQAPGRAGVTSLVARRSGWNGSS